MIDLNALKTELANPAYAAMTDAQAAASLNTVNVQVTTARTLIPSWEVIDALDPTETAALTALQLQRLNLVTGAGTVDASSAGVRTLMGALFPVGGPTRAALVALQNKTVTISRAVQLGFGEVHAGDVAGARRL